jgi:hypothetical protein
MSKNKFINLLNKAIKPSQSKTEKSDSLGGYNEKSSVNLI